MTTKPSTGTEIQEDAWNRGFDHVFDMGDWMHAIEIDPEYNDLMRLMAELMDGVRDQYRAANPCMGEFEWWHRSFRSVNDMLNYKQSVGTLPCFICGKTPTNEDGYCGPCSEPYPEAPACSICDGIHGSLCPIESPNPLYYEDERRQGR